MSRDLTLYLEDIVSACDRIGKYTVGADLAAFRSNDMLVDAVARNLEVIGEAAKQVPDELRSEYADVPWRRMAGVRDPERRAGGSPQSRGDPRDALRQILIATSPHPAFWRSPGVDMGAENLAAVPPSPAPFSAQPFGASVRGVGRGASAGAASTRRLRRRP